MCPEYPEFYPDFKDEGIAHIEANMYWTGDTKSREIFLREIKVRFNVTCFSCGKNDEMFYTIMPKAYRA